MKKVILKKGKERALQGNRHPWIFSGAVERFPKDFVSGEIAFVHSYAGDFLALAYFNTENSLSGRVLSFEKKEVEKILEEKIRAAYDFRKSIFDFSITNAFRLINAEEDGLPGLIVDYYDGVLALQINTLGMEKLRDLLLKALISIISPKAVYEKSTSSARGMEGLFPKEGVIYGEEIEELTVLENGVKFSISILEGQKTGFFLDQREMRKKIKELSHGKRVLNCFSYSGGFSLYALKGGATHVTSVDTCKTAVRLADKNSEINGFSSKEHEIIREDVFDFLEKEDLKKFDVIILDPPAFAKKRQDIEPALKGYKQLAEMVFKRCKPGTFLLTCSCSYFIGIQDFKQAIFKAASPSKKEVKIVSQHIQSMDHPISLFHPEGDYLKSLLLYIT